MIKGGINDVCIGKHTSFCVDEKEYIGLKNFVHISTKNKDIFIIDNHNHALYCRYVASKKRLLKSSKKTPILIHIDQHTDMGKPHILYKKRKKNCIKTNFGKNIQKSDYPNTDDKKYLAAYVNEILTINDFIIPAQEIGLIKDIIQIRTEQHLKEWQKKREKIVSNQQIILDIDTDFRDPRMSFENKEKSFEIIHSRIQTSCVFCVSIATSPYFMNQEEAIEIAKKLLKQN